MNTRQAAIHLCNPDYLNTTENSLIFPAGSKGAVNGFSGQSFAYKFGLSAKCILDQLVSG